MISKVSFEEKEKKTLINHNLKSKLGNWLRNAETEIDLAEWGRSSMTSKWGYEGVWRKMQNKSTKVFFQF